MIAKEVKSSCNSKCLPTKVLGCKFKFRNKHLPKKMGVRPSTTQLSQTPHVWELCALNMTFFTIVIAKFWQKRRYNVTGTHQKNHPPGRGVGGEGGAHREVRELGGVTKLKLQDLNYKKLQKHTHIKRIMMLI